MPFVVTEKCIRCKFTDCVDVCPVDAFRDGEQMLVIDPDACIDCAACEPACPTEAIEIASERIGTWVTLNRKMAAVWPSITTRREPLPDANAYTNEVNKFATYYNERPGSGDV
jgi:ferredoxin